MITLEDEAILFIVYNKWKLTFKKINNKPVNCFRPKNNDGLFIVPNIAKL